jgi:hypothetical protein
VDVTFLGLVCSITHWCGFSDMVLIHPYVHVFLIKSDKSMGVIFFKYVCSLCWIVDVICLHSHSSSTFAFKLEQTAIL